MALQNDSTAQHVSSDTLHLPWRDGGYSLLDVELPQYYREGFFSKDSLFHPELPGGRFGVAGTPVPYSASGDNFITSVLLVFFILLVLALAQIRSFIVRQAKNFFYVHHEGAQEMAQTGAELRVQMVLLLLTSLLLSLICYFYTVRYIIDSFFRPAQYLLIVVYFLMVVGYFSVQFLLYAIANNILFDGKRNIQWQKTKLFITGMEGVLCLPAVLLFVFLGLSEQNVIGYLTFVLFFVKLLTFFKCYVVFFRTNVVKLQIILYFCALEMMPLLAFGGALGFVANSLKIIF